MKSLILSFAALAALAAGGGKSYSIVVPEKSVVGTAELKPGEYKLELDGSNAMLRSADSRITLNLPVTVENAPEKFEKTKLVISKEGGVTKILGVQLGKTTTRIQFAGAAATGAGSQ